MKTTRIYRVLASPFEEDEDFPWEYEESAFCAWVDEVFLEGYKKHHNTPLPSPEECLDLLEGNGYDIEVVQESSKTL